MLHSCINNLSFAVAKKAVLVFSLRHICLGNTPSGKLCMLEYLSYFLPCLLSLCYRCLCWHLTRILPVPGGLAELLAVWFKKTKLSSEATFFCLFVLFSPIKPSFFQTFTRFLVFFWSCHRWSAWFPTLTFSIAS